MACLSGKLLGTLTIACLILAETGCTTSTGSWGENTTLTPGWERIRVSAREALVDPQTWVPLTGALLFSIGGLDEDTVDWATRRTPLFGNTEDAEDTSDLLKDLSKINYLGSALATPSRNLSQKGRGLGVGLLAIGFNEAVTHGIKSATNRKRPDNDRRNSFPSLHTSDAAIAATLAARNINHVINIPDKARNLWRWTSYSIAGLTGWVRVEAERHYPSDVLAGYALGHFLGALINDAFISPTAKQSVHISAYLPPDGSGAGISLDYYW